MYLKRAQEQALKRLLIEISKETNSVHAKTIEEFQILEAFDKDRHMWGIKEDIRAIADETDYDYLSDEHIEKLAHIAIKEFDFSDFNEYIDGLLEKYDEQIE